MFYQTTLFTDCLITLINYMQTPHYAYVDVLPVDNLAWMPYYTRHRQTASTTMQALMNFQTTLLPELFNEPFTTIRVVTTMYGSVGYQTDLITVCLITNISNIRSLTNMRTFMSFKIAPVTECFLTHITVITSHTTM
jgi:hypothetical protein